MCELFRALVAGKMIPGVNLDNLSNDSVSELDCPGDADEGQSEICAVSGGSAAQNYSWYILLDGISITANDSPKWILSLQSSQLLEAKKNPQ